MKKVLKLFMIGILLLGVFGCSNNNNKGNEGNNDKPAEKEIKGKTVTSGRLTVLVPDGWCLIDTGEYSDETQVVLLKGTQNDWASVPQLSIIYNMPTDLVISGAAFATDVIQQPSFDLGDYHWKAWTGSMEGLKCYAAESEGDFGYITVYLQQVTEGGETLSIEDEEVRAIIKSIAVQPTVKVDWIKLENGNAIITLQGVEGYMWDESGTMTSEGVDADYEIDGNSVTLFPLEGTGAYVINFQLIDEDNTEQMGEATVKLKVEDGKFTDVYDGTIKIYDEPEKKEYNWGDDTVDYDVINEILVGAWVDNPNGLTMFIQQYEELEHGYIITIQSDKQTMVMKGQVEGTGTLWYEEVTLNGIDMLESIGWFRIDGDYLIWGHDEVVGEYDNVNLFTKAE